MPFHKISGHSVERDYRTPTIDIEASWVTGNSRTSHVSRGYLDSFLLAYLSDQSWNQLNNAVLA